MQLIDRRLADCVGLGDEAEAVLRYFTLFNLGEYEQVASLFAQAGKLYPPFESPVVGSENITDYLLKEADGMTVSLLDGETQLGEGDFLHVSVRGQVTALVFEVNVTWNFLVDPNGKIESVRVDLVATLEELLRLRPGQQPD